LVAETCLWGDALLAVIRCKSLFSGLVAETHVGS